MSWLLSIFPRISFATHLLGKIKSHATEAMLSWRGIVYPVFLWVFLGGVVMITGFAGVSREGRIQVRTTHCGRVDYEQGDIASAQDGKYSGGAKSAENTALAAAEVMRFGGTGAASPGGTGMSTVRTLGGGTERITYFTASGRQVLDDVNKYAFAQATANSCAPTASRTIIAMLERKDPGEKKIELEVAAAQNTPNQNWADSYTRFGPHYTTYVATLTGVLGKYGISATAVNNVDADGSPTVGALADNLMRSSMPAIVQVMTPEQRFHTVTIQYLDNNFIICNLCGDGGTIYVSRESFVSGSIITEMGSYQIRPEVPIILPN